MNPLKLITFIIALILSNSTQAIDLTVGYQQTKKPTNGRWYQEEFAHNINSRSITWSIGNTHTINDWSIGYGYKYGGRYSSKALATASDANYANWRKGSETLWDLSTWIGEGKLDGYYINIDKHYQHFFIRSGLFFHKARWTMTIPDWKHTRESAPRYLQVKDNGRETGIVLGIGRKFKRLSFIYEATNIKPDKGYKATYVGWSHSFNVAYEF